MYSVHECAGAQVDTYVRFETSFQTAFVHYILIIIIIMSTD